MADSERASIVKLMNEIAGIITDGAMSFLFAEYKYMAVFIVCFCGILYPLTGWETTVSFVVGGVTSILCGWIGMKIAVYTNVRTAHECWRELALGFDVAIQGGSVMGLSLVSLGVIVLFGLIKVLQACSPLKEQVFFEAVAGYGLGGSCIALFGRVGGGIYTKAADVGADLAGKVVHGIPEDDPRNPAVIADNVGDNVGDVAGMGADLFESFVGSIIAAATLANGDTARIMLPFWTAGGGIVAALCGFFFVSTKEGASQKELMFALHKGTIVACVVVLGLSAAWIYLLFQWTNGECNVPLSTIPLVSGGCFNRMKEGWQIYACIVIGLFAGVGIGFSTEYFTSYEYPMVRSITSAGITGPATVIIQGLGIGMISTVPPTFILVVTILSCNALSGQYGIAMAAVGMLSTLGITLATDAYGPIADNAGGIAEMADLDERVRETTDTLDALGNTTAATGKGFAIGSAVLTSIALLTAFVDEAGVSLVDVSDPIVP